MGDVPAWLWPLVSAAFAWGGAYAAVRVHLKYLRRDVDETRDAFKDHLRRFHNA